MTVQVRKMRLLRHKHGITRPELGRACGLSPQRISEIELNMECLTPATGEKLRKGFYAVAARREDSLTSLRGDLARYESSLFEAVEEAVYEL